MRRPQSARTFQVRTLPASLASERASRPGDERRSANPSCDSKSRWYPGQAVLQLFAVIHVILSAALVGLILMHSGRDAGLGGMGFTPASQGGTHIVERNLTRLTIAVAVLFTANTVLLFHLLK
jgi:preprotein translocase subunit SecG